MSDDTALQRLPNVPRRMPAIAVKNAVIFPIPNLPIPLGVGRPRTMAAIEAAASDAAYVFVVTQRDSELERPGPADLYTYGSVCRILRMNRAADGGGELTLEGVCRGRINAFTDVDEMLAVEITPLAEIQPPGAELEALVMSLKELGERVIDLSPRLPDEAKKVLANIDDPAHLADLVGSQLRLSTEDKQILLAQPDVKQRLQLVIGHLAKEAEVLEISGKIRTEVRDSLDKHQREVFLREQLRA
ncbi:MAG: LON peptidase substrate-binding domain-containing protein, partial [Myxococcales bacterium]|nr:LON peptidase substrate-binding domain-containing protein [Myxococcales bacterium]